MQDEPEIPITVTLATYRELEEHNRALCGIIRDQQRQLDAINPPSPQECEEAFMSLIRQRREAGRLKYGVSMERPDLTPAQWAQHAQEEALDCAIYLERLKRKLAVFDTPSPA